MICAYRMKYSIEMKWWFSLSEEPELEYQPLPGVPLENEKPETSSNGGVSSDVC